MRSRRLHTDAKGIDSMAELIALPGFTRLDE